MTASVMASQAPKIFLRSRLLLSVTAGTEHHNRSVVEHHLGPWSHLGWWSLRLVVCVGVGGGPGRRSEI